MGERRGTKALELWCRRITEGYPGVNVQNMTTSWRDGLAFCAMIHHFRPDLMDFTSLDKDDIYRNNELAFRTAEQHLGIPALLDAEDMASCSVPDRLSILTYLSQFYQTFGGSSPSRLAMKRTTEVSEERLPPVPTSPQPKVGVSLGARREPCVVCGLPVFLAEKLVISRILYHRTCFRCARCNNQLTLGNYYETEDSQYCCETCPDEEAASVPVLHQEYNKTALFGNKKTSDYSLTSHGYERALSDEEKTTQHTPQLDVSLYTTALGYSTPKNKDVAIPQPASQASKMRLNFMASHLLSEKSDNSSVDSSPRPAMSLGKQHADDKVTTSLDESQGSSPEASPPPITSPKTSLSEFRASTPSKSQQFSNIRFDNDTCTSLAMDLGEGSVHSKLDSSIDDSISDNQHLTAIAPHDIDRKNVICNENTKDTPAVVGKKTSDTSQRLSLVQQRLKMFENNMRTERKDEACEQTTVRNKVEKPNVYIAHTSDNRQVDSEGVKEIENSEPYVQAAQPRPGTPEPEEKTNDKLEDSTENIKDELKNSTVNINDELKNSTEKTNDELKNSTENTNDQIKNSTVNTKDELENSTKPSKDIDISYESNKPLDLPEGKELTAAVILQKMIESREPRPATSSVETILCNVSGVDLSDTEEYPEDLNPFTSDGEDSSSEQKVQTHAEKSNESKVSTNPFGSSDDEEDCTAVTPPQPAARRAKIEQPADLPAKRRLEAPQISLNPFWSDEEGPGSEEDDNDKNVPKNIPVPKPRKLRPTPEPSPVQRRTRLDRGGLYASNSSITSTTTPGGSYRKKKPAPQPPTAKELFTPDRTQVTQNSDMPDTKSSSIQSVISPRTTPHTRKAKPAPPPPMPTSTPYSTNDASSLSLGDSPITEVKQTGDSRALIWNDLKNNKDETNRNRQSLSTMSSSEEAPPYAISFPDKSAQGKWKRKKGPAPPRPIPRRRKIKILSVKDVKLELDEIELQQQGLEKQGVRLEQLIRDKSETVPANEEKSLNADVEELVLELFALVNEKNELFRRQAELMLLRRQQRLEEEHADIEYQIRCLMTQPEATKTDSDKQREEVLIQRLVDIVERRNEIVECLEMDRRREVEEDRSIHKQMELYAARSKGDLTTDDDNSRHLSNLNKDKAKEKIKGKKLKKNHKKDVDKDVDETESKQNRHKRKWF